MTSFTRLLAQAKKERAMLDDRCVCGHYEDQHDVGCCLATSDCCCEGYLPDDEPRNGDAAEAEPSELSGRGWELWRVE